MLHSVNGALQIIDRDENSVTPHGAGGRCQGDSVVAQLSLRIFFPGRRFSKPHSAAEARTRVAHAPVVGGSAKWIMAATTSRSGRMHMILAM
jgi:hypothetical protein